MNRTPYDNNIIMYAEGVMKKTKIGLLFIAFLGFMSLALPIWAADLSLQRPEAAQSHYKIKTIHADPRTGSAPGVWTVQDSGARYVPGRLIVKYRDSVTESVGDIVKGKKRFRDHTTDRSDSLDRLHAEHRVKKARPVFRSETEEDSLSSKSLPAIRELHKRKIEKAKKQKSARTARAPKNYNIPDLGQVYVLELDSVLDIMGAVEAFGSDPHVEYAQPDFIARTQFVPNDPYYSSSGSWGQSYDDLWNLKKIQAGQAWDLSQGSGVVVGVVDTGIDATHPDIAANLVPGWDFVNNDSDPSDGNGHGTHTAGTVAAIGNNGIGIIGVAPQARIMPIKGLNDYGYGSVSVLASGVEYAAVNGADVINNSWGCTSACPSDPVVEDAVRAAYGLGAVVVFSAGNSNSDIANFSPQNMPEVVVVSSSDHLDQRSDFSNYGLVDVTAPGGESGPSCSEFSDQNILSLRSGNTDMYSSCGSSWTGQMVLGATYYRSRGTSMAAPHVSGLAALVIALHPEFASEQVRQALRHGSDDIGGSGFDLQTGYGRINAQSTLAETPLAALITRTAPAAVAGTALDVYGVAYGTGFSSWTLQYGSGSQPADWTTISNSDAAAANEALLATWDINAIPDGTYTLRIAASDAPGKVYEDRHRIVIDQVSISDPTQTGFSFFRSGNVITVSGTAAPADFSSYIIRVKDSTGAYLVDPAITLTNGGSQKVVNGVLGTWDTTGVTADHYTIELVVSLSSGMTTETTRVIVDPTLHPGWPLKLNAESSGGYTYSLLDHINAVDINGDGASELVVAYGQFVLIFDHNGTLMPGWPQNINPNNLNTLIQRSPAVGDITGDGIPEIAAINSAGEVFIWEPDGTPLPGWPKTIGGYKIAIADINSDGTNEMITTSFDRVYVFDNEGTSLPGWPKYFARESLGRVSIDDLDGDGQKEIVVMGYISNLLYVLDASGALLPGWPVQISTSYSGAEGYPALGDIDGDGAMEIVVGSPDGIVHAYHYDGTLVAGWPQSTKGTGVNSIAIGDIDGDNMPEVVAGVDTALGIGVYENYLYAWHGNGTLLAGWPVKYPRSISSAFFGFGASALADVDGDGKADVIASSDAHADHPFALNGYAGNGVSISGFPKPTANIGASSTNTAAIADLDGDGLLEMAWIDYDFNVYVWDLDAPVSSPRPWPMFHHDERHSGASTLSIRSSVKINSGAEYTNSPLVSLGLTCRSNTGGACSLMRFSDDNVEWSEWEVFAATKSRDLTNMDGTKTVYAQFKSGEDTSVVFKDSIILDMTAPQITITSPTAGLITDNRPLLNYTVNEDTVTVKVDGITVNKVDGNRLDALTENDHTVRVESTDAAGNFGFAEVVFTVDVPPTVTLTSPVSGYTSTATPLLSYTVSNGTVVVKVDGVVVNKTSDTTLDPLADGPHTVRVEATDTGGTGYAERSFTVDTIAPTVVISSPTATMINDNQPFLTYVVSDGAVTVKVDTIVVSKMSGTRLDPLAEGPHTVRVESTDAANNTGFAEVPFTIDVAPTVTIASPVSGYTSTATPLLSYTVSHGAVVVKVDNVVVNKVSGDSLDPLEEGQHTLRVEATDAVGHTAFAEVTFTVQFLPGFADNMDNGGQKWQSATGLWHIITTPATYANTHSGSSSWWYGNDATGTYDTGSTNSGSIISVPFTVPANAVLTFWSWEQTDTWGYDTRKVYLSIDNGNTWSAVFQKTYGTSYWHQESVDIGGFAGMKVLMKFEFNTVNSVANAYRGWYVDDVLVSSELHGPIAIEDFETGNLSRYPWVTSGNGFWTVRTTTKHGGVYAAEAPVSINDYQSAALELTKECAAGTMSFWYSVSSEVNWDYLTFYVDGIQKGKWSGVVAWTKASFSVTAGTHRFKWVYSKDSSGSYGFDTAWIDDIVIPVPGAMPAVTISSPVAGNTKNNKPQLLYTASDGATVVVKVDVVPVYRVSGDTLDPLTDGPHTVRLEATDTAGSTGYAEVTFTVDTVVPTVAISSPAAGFTKNSAPVLTYATSEGTAVVKVDDVIVSKASGSTLGPLADGQHTVRVESTDASGNIGFAEVFFTVDTTAPTVTISSPAAGLTKNNAPVLEYTTNEGTATVMIDGIIVSKASGSTLDILPDGPHTVRVEATDTADNTGFAEVSFAVDTTAPTITITSPVAGSTKNNRPVLEYLTSDGTVVVKVDGVLVSKVSGTTLDPLADGPHTVRVESTDSAWNIGFAEVIFVVDTVPPAISINPVTTPTNVNAQTITGTRENGAIVTVALNTTATAGAISYPTDTTWSCTINGLVEGANAVTVTATDAAGNNASVATSITYDSVAPTVVLSSPSAGSTSNNKPVLTYTDDDGIVVVKVDGNVVSKASGTTLDPLVDGTHTVRVEATDQAGNTGFAEVTFVVDTLPPTVTVDPVATPTRVNTQTIGGDRENGAMITMSIDTSASAGPVVYPTNTTWSSTVNDLAEGINNITITAKDAAQNSAMVTASITYDSIAPVVSIGSPVAGPTRDNTPRLDFAITGGTVSLVSVDGVTVSKTSGQDLDPLADGSHTVRVEAMDAAGNTGFAQATFTVDTIPPGVSINPVTTPTNVSNQTLTGTREENAAVTVAVNTSASVGAISYPAATTWSCTVSNLVTGSNTVTVIAIDAAGNPATAEAAITFDAIAPIVSLTSPGSAPTNDNTPLLTFDPGDGSVVVKVDGVAVSKASGDSLDTLSDGNHTVRVESTDAAGNTGFAQVTFVVDTVAPAISIDPVTTPTKLTYQTISGTREDGAAVTVTVNTSATAGPVSYASAATWSCTISNLVRGNNVITARAIDAANNSATTTATITRK